MIVYRSTYKTYLCTLIDYHFNTQILFAQERIRKKKDLYAFYILFLDKFQAFEENLYRM